MAKRCIVKNCTNHSDQGSFVRDICLPCYEFITQGEGEYYQAYHNSKDISSFPDHTYIKDNKLFINNKVAVIGTKQACTWSFCK